MTEVQLLAIDAKNGEELSLMTTTYASLEKVARNLNRTAEDVAPETEVHTNTRFSSFAGAGFKYEVIGIQLYQIGNSRNGGTYKHHVYKREFNEIVEKIEKLMLSQPGREVRAVDVDLGESMKKYKIRAVINFLKHTNCIPSLVRSQGDLTRRAQRSWDQFNQS